MIWSTPKSFETTGFYRRITIEEMIEVIHKRRRGKAGRPAEIPVKVWRCLDEDGIECFTRLFNVIHKTARTSDEWRVST